MMIIENYEARSAEKIPAGKHRIEVATTFQSPKPISPADVVVNVDGKEVAQVDGGAHGSCRLYRVGNARCRRRSRLTSGTCL